MEVKVHKPAVLPGDGIGPETTDEALKVLSAVEAASSVRFDVEFAPFGASAYFEHGHPFPERTRTLCSSVDAVLEGPLGVSTRRRRAFPPCRWSTCSSMPRRRICVSILPSST